MPKVKLTDRTVVAKKLRATDGTIIHLPPSEGIAELWDVIVPGLALRIGYGGKRTYTVTTRIDRRQVRRRIGTTYQFTLADARDVARDILSEAQRGNDPYSKRAKAHGALRGQQEAALAGAGTFRAVAEAWLNDTRKRGGANLRSKGRIQRRLEQRVFPKLGALCIAEITRAEVQALVGEIAQEYPVVGNHVLADLRRVFNFAVRNSRIDASPAAGVEPPGEEKSRERVLTDIEIGRLWRGADELGYPRGPIFKLLLLTGARRSEIGGMRWEELNDRVWILPGERAKNGRQHLWPLSTAARAILDAVPRIDDSAFVFPSQYKGRDPETGERTIDKPISAWGHAKRRIDEVIAEAAAKDAGEAVNMDKHGMVPWRIHDLRRTLVTGMNETLRVPHEVIELIIGHMSGSARAGVAGVYNRSEHLEQRKVALERWAQHIEGIVIGRCDI